MARCYRFTFLITLLASGVAFAQAPLHLKTRSIETGAAPDGHRHLLLQFDEAPTPALIAELRQRGITVLADVPVNGLLVSVARPTALDNLHLHYQDALHPSDKISPLITSHDAAAASGYFLVEFHADVDLNDARALLLDLGLELHENPDLSSRQLMIHPAAYQLRRSLARLAALDQVAYIFPASDELANGVPVRACEGALTTTGAVTQLTPTYGDGWDGVGLGSATVGYVFSRMTSQLDPAAAQSEIRRAMTEWAKVVRITWAPGSSATAPRTVNILFAGGEHGDGFPFDGQGGILAHTFYPSLPNPEPIAGDMHFDDAEHWAMGANTDLFSVALHELGHSLGLGHSDNPNDVMYPYYKMALTLAPGDVATALTLYAAQTTAPSEPLTMTVNTPASSTTASSISLSGSVAGGSGAIAITWSSSTGASGTALVAAPVWSIPSIPLAVGLNTITITAISGASQISNFVSVTMQTVAQPLTLTVNTPASSTTASGINLSGSVAGGSGAIAITWSNSTGASGTASVAAPSWSIPSVPLAVGLNTITITAISGASRISNSVSVTMLTSTPTSDTTAPLLSIGAPSTSTFATTLSSIQISGIASDNVGVRSVTWATNFGTSGAASGTTTWSATVPLLSGSNSITVRASDAAGNIGWRTLVVTRR